jgi:hypothetical protein
MSPEEFEALIMSCPAAVPVREVRLAFVQSMQTVVDEMTSPRGRRMSKLEFYEAVRGGGGGACARRVRGRPLTGVV